MGILRSALGITLVLYSRAQVWLRWGQNNLSIERTDPLPGLVSEAMRTRSDDRESQDGEAERWIAAVRLRLQSPSLRVWLGRAAIGNPALKDVSKIGGER